MFNHFIAYYLFYGIWVREGTGRLTGFLASGSSAPSVGVSNGEFDESDEMIGAVLVGLATDDGSGWADSIAAVLPNGDWSDALALTCRSTCEKRGPFHSALRAGPLCSKRKRAGQCPANYKRPKRCNNTTHVCERDGKKHVCTLNS